jgi:uncharacterized protein
MSVHLIIDGYNLIRQSAELLAREAEDLRYGREALLAKLAAYRRQKKNPITVVFDGWETGDPVESRDRFQGIIVIYSRRGEKADEVIKRLASREKQRSVVVSSDREILEFAENQGATTVSAAEFQGLLLMASTGTDSVVEDDDNPPNHGTQKKGPAHRLPKKARRKQQRIKKI